MKIKLTQDSDLTLEKGGNQVNLFERALSSGCPYAICSTAAATAAKTVTISNFLLLTNCMINVKFENAISIVSATLNVSDTGAKPMYLNGTTLQPGVVKAGMTASLVYNGSQWDIVHLSRVESWSNPADLYVDMGLPSGVLWAKKNIDVTQPYGFAASEYQYECSFFSWGNVDGHNPISSSAFDYDFGSNNEGPYASTPGAQLTGDIPLSYDAAAVNCGAPWRMPTTEEFAELFANIDYVDANGDVISGTNKLKTINSITGIRLKSKNNGNIIFFPCSGYGRGASWSDRGSRGYYWASSLGSSTDGRSLLFGSGGVYPQDYNNRFYGFAVRAVQ